jgi:hypothetical protein
MLDEHDMRPVGQFICKPEVSTRILVINSPHDLVWVTWFSSWFVDRREPHRYPRQLTQRCAEVTGVGRDTAAAGRKGRYHGDVNDIR